MKLTSLDELTDLDIGPIGTHRRDEFERKLADEIHAYHVGEAIKKAREAQSFDTRGARSKNGSTEVAGLPS